MIRGIGVERYLVPVAVKNSFEVARATHIPVAHLDIFGRGYIFAEFEVHARIIVAAVDVIRQFFQVGERIDYKRVLLTAIRKFVDDFGLVFISYAAHAPVVFDTSAERYRAFGYRELFAG